MTNFDDDIPDFPNPPCSGLSLPAAAGSAQVHTEETSEQFAGLPSYRDFVTSGCRKQIIMSRTVYESPADDTGRRRLLSYDSCRSSAWFMRHSVTGKIRVASSRCGLRWCPLCIRTRRFAIVSAVTNWMTTFSMPKFMTLTLKHSAAPLKDQIDYLYKSFKELRRSAWFKKYFFAGVWFFQVKISDADGLFHPHLHVLFRGKFIDHGNLSKRWKSITHGSSVVDVRAVKNPKKAAEYVARYAAAPCCLSDLDADNRVVVVQALHGRRIVGVFGSAKGLKLTPQKPDDAADWQKMGSYGIVMRFAGNNSDFGAIVECWRSNLPCNVLKPVFEPPEIMPEDVLQEPPKTFKQFWLEFMEV